MTPRLSLKKKCVRVVCTRVLNPINRTFLEYRLFEKLTIEMGELSGIEPPRMNWLAADLPTEFASFRQYCEFIFRRPSADKDESARVTHILLWVGQEGLDMYNTWDLCDADSKKMDVILGRFKALIEPKANFRLSRFNLQKFRQNASESVDEFMTRCRIQGKKCRFSDALEAE